MNDALVTVVKHSHYLKKAERLLSKQQIEDIANHGEVHLIDIFEKPDKKNLTRAEQNELAEIAALLKGDK